MSFYLQRADSDRYDLVDRYVWERWDQVVDSDGEKRYSGNGFSHEGGEMEFLGKIEFKDFGIICRILNVSIPAHATPKGFYDEPNSLKMVLRKGFPASLYDLETGTVYRAIKKAA